MEIKKYLDSMLPMFTRQRIFEDIEIVQASLNENTLPVYREYAKLMGKGSFKSDLCTEYDERFSKRFEGKQNGNLIGTIAKVLEELSDKIDVVQGMVEKSFADDVTRNAMTILRINVMQFLDTISYTVNYARRLLITLVSFEVNAYNPQISVEILDGELKWLEDNFATFCSCLNILDTKTDKIQETLNEIPDVAVNPDTVNNVIAMVGNDRVDPMRLGFIPVMLNPAYHIGMRIAEWQAARYDAACNEREVLQFRLLQLKLAQQDRNDAGLERKIKVTQDRVDKLNFKIAKMEER